MNLVNGKNVSGWRYLLEVNIIHLWHNIVAWNKLRECRNLDIWRGFTFANERNFKPKYTEKSRALIWFWISQFFFYAKPKIFENCEIHAREKIITWKSGVKTSIIWKQSVSSHRGEGQVVTRLVPMAVGNLVLYWTLKTEQKVHNNKKLMGNYQRLELKSNTETFVIVVTTVAAFFVFVSSHFCLVFLLL